ncbi:hypothetical protein KCP75_10775 [Salmonella enterica subsp. enterica]|nr:hypothetical protein KCP75_10775 [Salmonella enterica subsp. enterica]
MLHFHVLHNWLKLAGHRDVCEKSKRKNRTSRWSDVARSLSVTGRCAFTDGCEAGSVLPKMSGP